MSETKTIDEMREEIRFEAEVLDGLDLVHMYEAWFGGQWRYDEVTDSATNIEGEPIPDDVKLKFTPIRDLLPKREPK